MKLMVNGLIHQIDSDFISTWSIGIDYRPNHNNNNNNNCCHNSELNLLQKGVYLRGKNIRRNKITYSSRKMSYKSTRGKMCA